MICKPPFLGSSLIGIVFLSFSFPIFATSPSWQGRYAGVFVGDGLGEQRATTTTGVVTGSSYFSSAGDISAVNYAGSWNKLPSSAIGGLQIGEDWAFKSLSYGIILDYGALPLSVTTNVANSYPDAASQYSLSTSIQNNWLFTLRGRLGHPIMFHYPGLVYFTGGMALSNVNITNTFSDTTSLEGAGSLATTQNQIGWTVGTGIEIASFENQQIRWNLEFLYVDLPSLSISNYIFNRQGGFGIPAQSLASPFATSASLSAYLFKIELNYRFRSRS